MRACGYKIVTVKSPGVLMAPGLLLAIQLRLSPTSPHFQEGLQVVDFR
jgi:hypothetical protein